jgi:hypothetical protein
MRMSERMRVSNSSRLNGFGMKSSAPAAIAVCFSEPSLAVSMITGSAAVCCCLRSCLQTARPSGGHRHVEQHEVRPGGYGKLERSEPVGGRDDVVPLTLEHGLQQANVLRDVVDDEDPPGAVAHRLPPPQ